ncbi:hypothetical protein HZC32_00640 [Candidatus Woesearchaeota archaeon]|nr:hypothetical protein [Candidatus Woesearchaeota archaeon]
MLDFDGYFNSYKKRCLELIVKKELLTEQALLGTNFFKYDINSKLLLDILEKGNYFAHDLERYCYQTMRGSYFYSDFFALSGDKKQPLKIPNRKLLEKK